MRDSQWNASRAQRPLIGASTVNAAGANEFPWALLEGEPWMADALCPQTDPEAFFPEKGHSTREAKKICAECDVKQQCLDYAQRTGERFGIWGGLSERERRRLARGGPVSDPRKPSRWPAEVDERIRELNALKWSDARIAREIGRNQSAVRDHRIRMGLPFIDGRLASNQARRSGHE